MNHLNTRIVKAAFALAAAGMLMTAAAMGDTGFHTSRAAKAFDVQEAFSGIDVEDAECNVHILPAPDGRCRVICPEDRDGSVEYAVTVSGGTLRIERRDHRRWYRRIRISFGLEDIEVYLPEQAYERLEVRSTAGSIRVDGGFAFGSVRLKSVSGSIRMSAGVSGDMEAETTSGRIAIENAAPRTLAAASVSGRVVLDHVRAREVDVQSTSGRIELNDVVAEGSLFVTNTSGSVALSGCDGGAIRIGSVSGSVKGTLLTDKVFITHTTSGRVDVPRSASGGACEIRTTSGSIAIAIGQ